ncbi:hypothetical protein HIM_00603 [Hirsutella minnesotensis 3608]|nr:hypothetical protein HIM_00603 [Hirsutella minnesotensis 3608]
MGDYYHHFLSSVSGMPTYLASNSNGLELSLNRGVPMPYSSSSLPTTGHQGLEHLGSFHDTVFFNSSRSAKGRRKLASGPGTGADPVKHRRTRSGCFMCRSRRVKCDETHPICERCKKGNRECVYPDPPNQKGHSTQSMSKDADYSTKQNSPRSLRDDEDVMERSAPLPTIFDEDESSEGPSPSQSSQTPGTRNLTPSSFMRPVGKPSQEEFGHGFPTSKSPNQNPGCDIFVGAGAEWPESSSETDEKNNWSHLPPDFQYYLQYFVDNITHYHYSIANDGDDFFSALLPQIAVLHEPLLHAVVGFSAYHEMLQNPDGKLQDFLKYYNGGVTLLLDCLKRKDTNNVPTLMTILQLATIEEFLGDWVNLMGHQKAALGIVTQLFDPETVMHTAVGRMCLNWYSRYDNYVAIMGGFPTELSREWFDAMAGYNQSQMLLHPNVLRWKIDDRSTRLRLISYSMSMLYARSSRGQISLEEFVHEHETLTQELYTWRGTWDRALENSEHLVTDFYYRRRFDAGDIVDPYKPGILFDSPLFSTTLITAEWHSIMIMHLSQSASIPPSQLLMKLGEHAYAACQYFESVEFWPSRPKGAMASLQPCISIAALFLPQDARHQMWIRRKFAYLDMLGFIHPTTRRMKMAQLFGDPSCAHWWLPNEEGLTPVLRSIRNFADERNAAAVDAQLENIREVRHLFAKLELGIRGRGAPM